jgi:SET domain-containing protein
MMLVSTYIAPSIIEGVGVFADQFIRAGAMIWRFDPMFDRLLTHSELSSLPDPLKDFVNRYGYPHMMLDGITVVEIDNGRFMNHSPRPNTVFTHPEFGYAKMDIPTGSELLCDYGEFDPSFKMQPGRQFLELNGADARM